MQKQILITGGCGFVGSHLAVNFKAKYPDYKVVALDNLRRRGSELNLNRLKEAGVEFVHGDIRNAYDLEAAGKVDVIIDAAAEPSVMSGLDGSSNYLVDTNFNGTVNCLNYALRHKADFIFLSTSRVYPIKHIEEAAFNETETRFQFDDQQNIAGLSSQGLTEDFPMDGSRSIYGATKLGSELMVEEYNELLGLRSVINRCGVLTGPYQMGKVDQGVTVLWVARHFWQKPLSYIGYGGTGKQVRDILYIDDLFELVDWQMHNLDQVNGKTYNVGGGLENSVSLQELTMLCEEVTGNRIEIAGVPETRKADVRIYITDNSKVTRETGWKPKTHPREMIERIFEWIQSREAELQPILS